MVLPQSRQTHTCKGPLEVQARRVSMISASSAAVVMWSRAKPNSTLPTTCSQSGRKGRLCLRSTIPCPGMAFECKQGVSKLEGCLWEDV